MQKTLPLPLLLFFVGIYFWLASGCSRVPWGISQSPSPSPGNLPYRQLQIHDIQGASHSSPLAGEVVEEVTGVVTLASADGFFMQSLEPDEDPATSEGIWVAAKPGISVAVGDIVSVSGSVDEFFPGGELSGGLSTTRIKLADLTVLKSSAPLPEPVLIGENGRMIPNRIVDDDQLRSFQPESDGIDFFESLEGMLIQVQEAVAVAPTDGYGEIAIVVNNGKDTGPRTITGGLCLQPDDANPERILLDDAWVPTPSVTIGTRFPLIVGVMDYSYGNFKLQPSAAYEFIPGEPQLTEVSPPLEGQLRIASYNVENLDALDSEERFNQLAYQIVEQLFSPDLIALQEIQDDHGAVEDAVVDASQTWGKLIQTIQNLGGPTYEYREIPPLRNSDGGEPGGNVRVGFLFRTDRGLTFADLGEPGSITPVEVQQEGSDLRLNPNPGRIEPNHEAFRDSRKPLAAQFRFKGTPFIVINLHLASRSGDTPLFGSLQPTLEKSSHIRREQAAVIQGFTHAILKADRDAKIILLGDFNDHSWSEPLQIFSTDELVDLVTMLPLEERFTYIFEGNSQALDHILLSQGTLPYLADYSIIHLNTGFPPGKRFSDHDPQLLTLQFYP